MAFNLNFTKLSEATTLKEVTTFIDENSGGLSTELQEVFNRTVCQSVERITLSNSISINAEDAKTLANDLLEYRARKRSAAQTSSSEETSTESATSPEDLENIRKDLKAAYFFQKDEFFNSLTQDDLQVINVIAEDLEELRSVNNQTTDADENEDESDNSKSRSLQEEFPSRLEKIKSALAPFSKRFKELREEDPKRFDLILGAFALVFSILVAISSTNTIGKGAQAILFSLFIIVLLACFSKFFKSQILELNERTGFSEKVDKKANKVIATITMGVEYLLDKKGHHKKALLGFFALIASTFVLSIILGMASKRAAFVGLSVFAVLCLIGTIGLYITGRYAEKKNENYVYTPIDKLFDEIKNSALKGYNTLCVKKISELNPTEKILHHIFYGALSLTGLLVVTTLVFGCISSAFPSLHEKCADLSIGAMVSLALLFAFACSFGKILELIQNRSNNESVSYSRNVIDIGSLAFNSEQGKERVDFLLNSTSIVHTITERSPSKE